MSDETKDVKVREHQLRIRRASRFAYDIQKLRIASSNRSGDEAETAALSPEEKEFLGKMAKGLHSLEKEAIVELKRQLKGFSIYEHWLVNQKGVGPAMAGVLVGSFDIERADTVSKMWKFSGLDVVDGHAPRRTKGQKTTFNPWLRAKLVKVLAECLIRVCVQDGKGGYEIVTRKRDKMTKEIIEEIHTPCTGLLPHRKTYDDYKHRKTTQMVPTCMACEGKGTISRAKLAELEGEPEESKKLVKLRKAPKSAPKSDVPCTNCTGTGGPAPWGKSKAHREIASRRYMIKMFLIDFHKQWRELEGLPVRPPYREEKLGLPPHSRAASTGDTPTVLALADRVDKRSIEDQMIDEEIASELDEVV